MVTGTGRPVTIRRDRWGVPHIEAESEPNGWYGLGFCHGQDRTFQLESLLRMILDTLAELIGPEGLAIERLSRRIGFFPAGADQMRVLRPDLRDGIEAYARGVNEGFTLWLRRRPHEFALIG